MTIAIPSNHGQVHAPASGHAASRRMLAGAPYRGLDAALESRTRPGVETSLRIFIRADNAHPRRGGLICARRVINLGAHCAR
jgi:hypothetical protein